jgi:hypothetical protein
MDIEFNLYKSEEGELVLDVQGQARGKVYFRNFTAFTAFVIASQQFLERCEDSLADRCQVPDVILSAFDDELSPDTG